MYGFIEAQASTGSLLARSRVIVQCLHQHTCLFDVLHELRRQPTNVINSYLKYKTHVSRQVCETPPDLLESKSEEYENYSPGSRYSTRFKHIPTYLQDFPYNPLSIDQNDDPRVRNNEG